MAPAVTVALISCTIGSGIHREADILTTVTGVTDVENDGGLMA